TNPETSIIHAAQAVFLRKGLQAASMNDIAKQAGISRPSLHYYHRTKHALFQAILIEAVENIIPKIAPIVKSDLPLIRKAEEIVDHYHEVLLENPLLPRFLIQEIQRDPLALLDLLQKHSDVVELALYLRQTHAHELRDDLLPDEPIAHFFNTLYGLLFFPFLTKPLLDEIIFKDDPAAFAKFIAGRKVIILRMVASMLKPRIGAVKKTKR
ncbi:MAG: TetR/AcrR family transcriptional regulator, partial [Puniceicoccales bacterium]|nr:TetR/AcrR family transcriptional regulator [Puniceicoccales bacterium]